MLHVVGRKLLSCFQQKKESGNICMLIIVEKYFTSVQSIEQKKIIKKNFHARERLEFILLSFLPLIPVWRSVPAVLELFLNHPRQLRCESFSFFN